MSEKLTCKMSDGTEWEVDARCPWHATDGTEKVLWCFLKPIKREPKEEIDLTKLTEVKTYEGMIGSGVDDAIRTLAKMASLHKCLARMEVNGITLTAVPWMSEEGNFQYCKDLFQKKLKEPKREPREWWTVLFSPDDNPVQLQAIVRFETKEKAEQWAKQYYEFIQYEAVHVREVI